MKFPEQIINELENKYWYKRKNFKALLKWEMVFPLKLPLKAPATSSQMLANIRHIQDFTKAWQKFNNAFLLCQVEFESQNFQQFGVVNLLQYLRIENRAGLIAIFSQDKQIQLQILQNRINQIIGELHENFQIDTQEFLNFLIDNLESFEHLLDDELNQFLQLLPQLIFGMGNGNYLRTLSIASIDSKFIENHFRLIECFLDFIYNNQISESGGLMNWLNCQDKPNDWLLIEPLCLVTKSKLANLSLFRLNSQTLLDYELPADNILVIENEQSCLMLDNLANTIAVAGGGKNLGWLKSDWLNHKKIYYWGDIGKDGLLMLSLARYYCKDIMPIMMNRHAILSHQALMVNDQSVLQNVPEYLNNDEKLLFLALKNGEFLGNRLEQERLDNTFVNEQLYQLLQ